MILIFSKLIIKNITIIQTDKNIDNEKFEYLSNIKLNNQCNDIANINPNHV